MFSFWVNNIFAEKQVLFDIFGLMQSRQVVIKVIRLSTVMKGVHEFGNWQLK